jgi:hypothetical protein
VQPSVCRVHDLLVDRDRAGPACALAGGVEDRADRIDDDGVRQPVGLGHQLANEEIDLRKAAPRIGCGHACQATRRSYGDATATSRGGGCRKPIPGGGGGSRRQSSRDAADGSFSTTKPSRPKVIVARSGSVYAGHPGMAA